MFQEQAERFPPFTESGKKKGWMGEQGGRRQEVTENMRGKDHNRNSRTGEDPCLKKKWDTEADIYNSAST